MLIQKLKGAKMNWKNRLTNYNFWISIFSAVLLILQALKIEFDIAYVNEIFTAVLGLLVVIGIISDPTRTTIKSSDVTAKTPENNKKSEEKIANDVSETEKSEETNAENMPTAKEDETNYVHPENDLQIVLTEIKTSLDQKMQELVKFNAETLNKINATHAENTLKVEEEIKSSNNEIQQVAMPAVAEISNPFVDVIN